MKEIIIGFILYVIWDNYMRKRDEGKYVTRKEFIEFKDGQSAVNRTVDLSGILTRIENLEKSPYQ